MKKQKLITMLVLMIILILSIVGCGNENNKIPAAGNEENNHAEKEAYAKLLQDYQWLCDNTDYEKVPNEVKFLPLDVDQNGSYELLIYHNTSSADAEFTVSVITYNDGEISIEEINAGHGGYYGYDKENKVFATKHLQQGFETKVLYTIENNKIKEVCRWMDAEGADDMFQGLYEINGQAVDEDEFTKFTSLFNLNTTREEYKMHEISYENIVKYLGVDTMDDDDLTFLEAKHLILENDSEYLSKVADYKFIYEDEESQENKYKDIWNFFNDNCISFAVSSNMTAKCSYIVDRDTRDIYIISNQGTMPAYRIINNEVLERTDYPGYESQVDWRKVLGKEQIVSIKPQYLEKLDKLIEEVDDTYYEKREHVPNAERVVIAEERYEKWDEMINLIWSELKKQLPENDMDKLTEEQLQWIKRKENLEAIMLENPTGAHVNFVMIHYYEELASITLERCYELVQQHMI